MDSNGRCDRTCEVTQEVDGQYVRLPLRGLPCDGFCKALNKLLKERLPWQTLEQVLERLKEETEDGNP